MPDLLTFLCVLNKHQPDRRNVGWDGKAYVGQCRRCSAPIKRLARKKWRRVDGVTA
jgi:hypothetical protein